MKRFSNGIILPVILLLIWYLITRMQIFSPYLLPSPGMVWDALTELTASGEGDGLETGGFILFWRPGGRKKALTFSYDEQPSGQRAQFRR